MAKTWSRQRINLEDLTLEYFEGRTIYDHVTECLIWTGAKASGGYAYCGISRKLYYGHRLAFYLKWGHWPIETRHSCDRPSCVAWWHLSDGSKADNMRDARERGRLVGNKGWTGQPRARLDWDKVREIRASKSSTRTLAEHFGVTWATIQNVRAGKTWKE